MNKHFFYSKTALLNLSKFGIEIPFTDDRATKVLEFLKERLPNIQIQDCFPKLTKDDLILGGHSADYISRLFNCDKSAQKEVVNAFELINSDGTYNRYNPKNAEISLEFVVEKYFETCAMTYYAALSSLESKFSFCFGGGFHHAMSFGGRGFCLLNDVIIAIRKLQREGKIKTAWVIDVDAHKGDGTAELVKDDPSIRCLSIHMKDHWPLDEGNGSEPWFIESDVDIPISSLDQGQYLEYLEQGLENLESLSELPELCLVVQGSDPYEEDRLPSSSGLKLSLETLKERDLLVYNFLESRDIPQVYTMAGGYGPDVYKVYCQFLKELLPRLEKPSK